MNDLKSRLGDDFPEELIDSAYSLSELGLNEFAWKYEDILKVIEYCFRRKIAILGGDVYCLRNSTIEFTYETWYSDQDGKDWDDYVKESKEKSLVYISNYDSRNKDNIDRILYVIVPGKEN